MWMDADNNEGTSCHGKSKSSWGLSHAVHAVHGVGFVAKKVVNNRITESLWHSKKSSRERDNHSHEIDAFHHASKPSLDVADKETSGKLCVLNKDAREKEPTPLKGRNVIDESEDEDLKPRDGSHVNTRSSNASYESESLKSNDSIHVSTKYSNVLDQFEDKKPRDGTHVRNVNEQRRPSTSGTNVWPSTTGSNVVDDSRSSKPLPSSHVRPIGQHRWPSTTSSNLVAQSENSRSSDGSHARLVNQQRWPGTGGSNVLSKNSNHSEEASRVPNLRRTSVPNYASKLLPESSRDVTRIKSSSVVDNSGLKADTSTESQPSSPNKSYGLASRGVSPSRTQDLTPPRGVCLTPYKGVKLDTIVRGVSLTPVTKSDSQTPASRGVSLTPTTRNIDPPPASREVGSSLALKEVESSLITRGVSSSPTTRGVSPSPEPRVVETTPTVRGSIPVPPARGFSPTPTGAKLNKVSISTESCPFPNKEIHLTPSRGVSPSPSDRSVSPTPSSGVSRTPCRGFSSHVRDASPIPVKHSARRHFFNSHILSIFTGFTDHKKDKHVTNHQDAAQHLELLYNIQVQWQFANASAEAALHHQRTTAEKSLFDMWKTTLELRDSISVKKIDIGLLILQLKLYAVLYRQMAYIDEWASIQKEYESALSITTNDLQARSLSVPVIGGVKADIKDLKLMFFSTIQVLQSTVSSTQSSILKLDKTHFLASELANVALHERALLDECEIFLASGAPLQIEECSLRSYIIQSNQTSMSE